MTDGAEGHRAGADMIIEAITLSRNEIESLCMKAARGAGFSWGLAEEAGFAAGWLAARGIDGTAPLLRLLKQRSRHPAAAGAPRLTPGFWHCSDSATLCPIATGAALLDTALLADGPLRRDIRLDPVSIPVLILPFLARTAQTGANALTVDMQGTSFVFARDGTLDPLPASGFIGQTALAITMRTIPHLAVGRARQPLLPSISRTVLDGLNAFALQTTVPATDISRRGAGSTTLDD